MHNLKMLPHIPVDHHSLCSKKESTDSEAEDGREKKEIGMVVNGRKTCCHKVCNACRRMMCDCL